MSQSSQPRAVFSAALEHLADLANKPDARWVRMLSAPTPADRELWRACWPGIETQRRRWIARALLETAESSFEVEFTALCTDMLRDEDAQVRVLAIDALWECQNPRLIDPLVELATGDLDPQVRAHAAAALGPFVLQGELGRLHQETVDRLVRVLAKLATDEFEDINVRRRATESIGYAQHPEAEMVLRAGLEAKELPLRAGALRGIGNSASPEWADTVLAALEAEEPELRFEAARAAGELALNQAVPSLLRLAECDDREIQLEAIWALGEVGGRHAVRALELLARHMPEDDEDRAEALAEAMAMAGLDAGDLA